MITPELLLNAYANGYFPMAESAQSDELLWFHPEQRGVLPLEHFHIPRSLAKFLRTAPFTYRTNSAFAQVIEACSQNRDETWINTEIKTLYTQLHERGYAHSVEVYAPAGASALSHAPCERQQARSGGDLMLIGGLYGVALGGAFFGESMFSRKPNASKAALVYLVNLLKTAGYTLLDTQYTNPHLTQFGIEEIPREEYLTRLSAALPITPQRCFE